MATYLHPGVYMEELPSGSKPIEAVGTSVAAFVGYIEKGPLDEPTLITSWDEYERTFGGLNQNVTVSGLQDPMGHGIYAFFQNGGTKAYVTRVAKTKDAAGKDVAPLAASWTSDSAATPLLRFEAVNEGEWGDSLTVRITHKSGTVAALTSASLYTVEIGTGTVAAKDWEVQEKLADVSLNPAEPRFIESVVSDGSKLLTCSVDSNATADQLLSVYQTAAAATGYLEAPLQGGTNSTPPDATAAEYHDVFKKFEKIRDINILLLPGQSWDGSTGEAILGEAIAHCELMRSRMLILDIPPTTVLADEGTVDGLSLQTSTYCTLYYPWVKVTNPFYDADTNPGAERTILVAPSAFAAGMWAKIDGRRGVWKAPAGVETALLGVAGLEVTVEDAEQDYLNPLGVNALRKLPSYGNVIWGARTLATKMAPEWRYVPVRRTAIFIQQSIYNGIQWAVFEPNDHRLWSSLRANIESFMSGLFRAGAFQGEKASDAFFVRCGLGSTMTQDDIDRGQVIVLIGFAPLKPAEFVIVRIQQAVGQQ